MSDKVIINAEIKGNVGEVSKEIQEASNSADKLQKNTKKSAGSFQLLGNVIKGVGRAIKKAGIGILVGLLIKMMDVFRKNQTVLDGFNVAMETLSIAFNDFFAFLQNNVGKVAGWFKNIFEDPAASVKKLGDAIK